MKTDLNLPLVREKIIEIEDILSKYEIHNDVDFKVWLKEFRKIYGKDDTNLRLYVISALLYFMGLAFIANFILKDKELFSKRQNLLSRLKETKLTIDSNYRNLKFGEIKYFNPIFYLSEEEDLSFFSELIHYIFIHLNRAIIKQEFFFDYLIQAVISPFIRHKSGEYYTPPFLAKKMVDETYNIRLTVLDPCCGSGNFLIEIIKSILSQDIDEKAKIRALNNIYGFDINPISIYISKINILFLLKDNFPKVQINLFVLDYLSQAKKEFLHKFDLIIGNPPWYTYRDVDSIDSQEKLKILAEELEIKPRPKNLLNLEISTLFFYISNKSYMKDNGKIFLVITKGVITGSHASRFRNFKNFSDIKIWMFNKKLEQIFNIDFICLYGQKKRGFKEKESYEIPSFHYGIENNSLKMSWYEPIELKLQKREYLIPFSIEKRGEKSYVSKLIPKGKLTNLLPIKTSYYKELFHKGADLNPRNLIFVKFEEKDEYLAIINPEERIFKKAKSPWNRREFENEIVSKKYLFKVIKSTELVKFHVYDFYTVFLPLSRNDLRFDYNSLDKHSKIFYDKINEIYLKFKKSTTTHKNLLENLNRWEKLINERQRSHIKVVYNNSGSILNCAVVQGDYLVTGDLSFFNTKSLDEAFYLSAILNSPILTKQIKIMKSSRHIFKLPLELPIKKYNISNPRHQKLVQLGRKGHEIASKTVETLVKEKKDHISKPRIQSLLEIKLESIFTQIDNILTLELKT
ncbi:MAG: class I SAM-dependent DNA methyltransferase [Candidatus Heimdallarchaeota archaeon]